MIDRSFGDFGPMLRSPDLRIEDVRTDVVTGVAPLIHHHPRTDRGTLVYLLQGDFTLEVEGSRQPPRDFAQGTAIGFEDGRAHRWRTRSSPGSPVALFVSSIPPRMSLLRRLDDRFIALPPDAEPHATTLRLAVELHLGEHLAEAVTDDLVIRRCAEICLIQLIRYARASMLDDPHMPPQLAHDEYLLRAWSAYFREPRRRWTVAALAAAAGLGRTAFAQRFHKVFGAPPLQALTEMRLEQAATMLTTTRAALIEIAFTIGYNSEAAFVRAFHRRYGMPPGRYRAEHGRSS